MRLHLPFEAPWVVKEGPSDQRVAVLPGTGSELPASIVTYGRIALKPDEPRRWIERVVHSDIPAGTKVQVGRILDNATVDGWSMRLVESLVTKPNGDVVEARLSALYTFMEHAAEAIVRAPDRAGMDRVGGTVLAVLSRGRPDWSGEPACLADVWDLEPRASRPPRAIPPGQDGASRESLQSALAQVDEALASDPTAAGHIRRGTLLLELGRREDALHAFQAAVAQDATSELAHYFRGIAYGSLGDHKAAIAAWEQALALAPDRPDIHYNLAQAKFLTRDYAGALTGFERVLALDPHDFLVRRKIVQSLYALGRFDEAQAARIAFREAWQTSRDPRAELITEYVFDQFDGDGFSVHAIETLRPKNPAIYTMLTFAAVHRHGDHEHPLGASVLVETSEQARAAGTPFVLATTSGAGYRVLGAAAALPAYPELKRDVLRILGDAIKAGASDRSG